MLPERLLHEKPALRSLGLSASTVLVNCENTVLALAILLGSPDAETDLANSLEEPQDTTQNDVANIETAE